MARVDSNHCAFVSRICVQFRVGLVKAFQERVRITIHREYRLIRHHLTGRMVGALAPQPR